VSADRPIYSSYIYTPGIGKPMADPHLIIAYERRPFTTCQALALAPKERWVLFGNGQVGHLTDAEFAEAVLKNEERRRKLGWPTSTRPVGFFAKPARHAALIVAPPPARKQVGHTEVCPLLSSWPQPVIRPVP